MLELIKRYKAAVKGSALALQKRETISSQLFQIDQLYSHLQRTRAQLAQAVAEDSAALLALRSRETVLAEEVAGLGARRAGHAEERASAGAALALSGREQASLIRAAASSVAQATGSAVRTAGRETAGTLRAERNYSMAVSHRLDASCTGTLPGMARPTVVSHARTLPRAGAGLEGSSAQAGTLGSLGSATRGGAGPAFSPMRPRGGSAPKAGGLTIHSSKGGGAVAITSACSQGSRITIQDEAGHLGYRTPADREFASITAPAREMSIRRAATGV